ncbi:MAG TPA: methyltransferase domain-containing protein [Actinobacteria bacterium]|nr:methyltransferase domain-containing protein [Actinomycetota bacterium]
MSPSAGARVFAGIADRYDRLNRILSLGRDQAWRARVVARLPAGRLLDLGAGTGAANPLFGDREVVALDPSPEMLALDDAPHRVVGMGEALPFADASFDAVFSAYVFRNLESVSATAAEIARVLRPGGRAGIVDLGRPRHRVLAAMHRGATAVVLPLAGATIGARDEYAYLHRSLDRHPPPEELFADTALEVVETWRMGPFGFVWGAILTPRPMARR